VPVTTAPILRLAEVTPATTTMVASKPAVAMVASKPAISLVASKPAVAQPYIMGSPEGGREDNSCALRAGPPAPLARASGAGPRVLF